MKVHSWKTLLATIFVGGGYVIYQTIHFDNFFDLIWLCLFAYLIIQGLCVSFSEKAHEEEIKKTDRGKRVYRKLFGPLSPIAPYSPLLFYLLVCAVAILLPNQEFLVTILFLLSAAYSIGLAIIVNKQMRVEEIQEFLQHVNSK